MKNWLFTTTPKKLEYYKGILIHADTNVHEQAANLLRIYVPKGKCVIDIGAGAGAFSQRLADIGYDISGLDIDEKKWIPTSIPFIKLDIDKGIQESIDRQYDAACCFEVIEHVENPWNLMREIRSVLKPGGLLLLSTPNTTSFLSRAIFLLKGRFHQFDNADLSYGHISPITAFEVSNIAKSVGWEILEIRPGGYLPIFDFTSFAPKWLFLNLLRGLVYSIAKEYKNGWCLFFVMRKRETPE
jgi:2-polyprenyl-3-methyl-5-hydroxy-6-metoxy-1,4-benzoquinol methylase